MKKLFANRAALSLTLASLLLGGASNPARAGDAETFYKFYSYYHATWEIEEESEGKKKTYTGKCYGSGGDCNIYVDDRETSIWDFVPGILSAKTLRMRKVSDSLLLANGTWEVSNENGQFIRFGQWGNIFEIQQDGSVLMKVECAGIFVPAP